MAEEVITIDSDDDDDPAPGPSSSSMTYSPANYSNMIPVSSPLGLQWLSNMRQLDSVMRQYCINSTL